MRTSNFTVVEADDLSAVEFSRQQRFPVLFCSNPDCKEPPYGGFENDSGIACPMCAIRDPQTGRILEPRGIRTQRYIRYDE